MPAFYTTLIGSYTLLQSVIFFSLRRLAHYLPGDVISRRDLLFLRVSRLLAAFIASFSALPLLNRPYNSTRQVVNPPQVSQDSPDESRCEPTVAGTGLDLVGTTLDLTLLVAIRAAETLIGQCWYHYLKNDRLKNNALRSPSLFLGRIIDSGVFSLSSGIVMWKWFYEPHLLPSKYRRWIGEAAQVDDRLVTALRNARGSLFVYGKDTGQTMLQSMCKDYNWPLEWGNPAVTIPVPCEVIHMGAGPSCHLHGLSRFARAFKYSFLMYFPIQVLLKLRRPSTKAFTHAVKEATRSSAFLGTFIALFFYSVCLSRTLLGPKILPGKPQMWDSGWCIGTACAISGWSVLLEKKSRRAELAYFVAPRAAAVFFPRRYSRKVKFDRQTWFERCLPK